MDDEPSHPGAGLTARRVVRLPEGMKGNHYTVYQCRVERDVPEPELRGQQLKIREPRDEAFWYDRRILLEEPLMELLEEYKIPGVPRVVTIHLDDEPGAASPAGPVKFQQYVPGCTLGKWLIDHAVEQVPERYVQAVARLMAGLAGIPLDELPTRLWHLPEKGLPRAARRRPEDGVSFLQGLIAFTAFTAQGPHARQFKGLYRGLGIRTDVLNDLMKQARRLTKRPLGLLHGDLHRENLIIDHLEDLWFIDWELAAVGDPLYELATHLHLMRYSDEQELAVVDAWREAVTAVLPDADAGMDEDLQLYKRYKRVQSVFTDVQRQAHAVLCEGDPPRALEERLDTAAQRVREALARAQEFLGLDTPPSAERITSAYADWLRVQSPSPRFRFRRGK